MNDSIPFMTAADCARQIGITVKALRVYEDHGLLSPPRSEKNWRLYGAREVNQLNEILTFKAMGFSLSRITELLSGHESTTDSMLALQQSRLTEHRKRIDDSLGLVTALREKTARGEDLSIADLVNLAKEMQMSETPNSDVAWKRYEQMRPRIEIDSDPDQLVEYAGYYSLSDEAVVEITVENSNIYVRMSGQMRLQMFMEELDKFFVRIVPVQIVFDRVENNVTGLTIHQDGLELPAVRSDKPRFDAAEVMLKAKAARTDEHPASQDKLRKIIEILRAGTTNYDMMMPRLAQTAREQSSLLSDELNRLGEIEHIDFQHVDEQGYDVFDVAFENGMIEYRLSTASDQRLDGLYMRPSTRVRPVR